MKPTKYSYNKSQHIFVDAMPQSRFYKNINAPTHRQSNAMKDNSFITNMESSNYIRSNGGITSQNIGYFYHQTQQIGNGLATHNTRQRFAPYPPFKRSYANTLMQPMNIRYYNYQSQIQQQQTSSTHMNPVDQNSMNTSPIESSFGSNHLTSIAAASISNMTLTNMNSTRNSLYENNSKACVTLQISNLDTTIEENVLKQNLINRLKPITTVLSIYFESLSVAKIKLPSDHQARQVIAYLHRKKIGHKRITVSFTRESSTLDSSTLRCQVAGLLKDIPNYKLSMYKFRELFQSRFKTSISVVDLHEMKEICTIIGNKNEEFITLRPELIDSIENSELMECFQHSVPYCTLHFVKTHRGWAEQEIDPLPNVQMTISQVHDIIFDLMKNHESIIPIASIVHCIQSELNINLERNENGVNFEHLISCVQGVQISSNKFSIKILSWLNSAETSPKNREMIADDVLGNRFSKYGNTTDSFTQISREIVELIKLSPKATLKFSRFIPAYHNHFGKQCRVADYGYTKLIDLFEALSSVVQVMGEGENRQITLTHRVQMQRFKTDLLRILRTQSTKSILLSHLPMIYEQVQGKKFNITDYGVCDIDDILDCLVNTNVVVVTSIPHIMDTMISIPKRKQSAAEVEKTSHFAAEVVELFKHASQYTILFEKFACSYHYHFGYQCRLSDYGFLKLADLMESIAGIVEMEFSNEEDRKIFLSPQTAQRIFSEQLKSLVESYSGNSSTIINLHEILIYHKKHYGYQIVPQTLGFEDWTTCINSLPYVEVLSSNGIISIKCRHDDQDFRNIAYASIRLLLENKQKKVPLSEFIRMFSEKYNDVMDEHLIKTMKHAITIQCTNNTKYVKISELMSFVVDLMEFIEMRGTVKVQDIFSALKLSIKACFPFGYPNLNTFLLAFPDIFLLTLSKSNNVRNEVTVNSRCILSKTNSANNNNNNELDAVDYNKNNLQYPSTASNSCLTFDNLFNNNQGKIDHHYQMNLTCVSESIEQIGHGQESMVQNSKNISSQDDIEKKININIQQKNVSTTRNDNSISNGDKLVLKRTLSIEDINCKKFYGGPPKPDTPPTSPYWMNPIWQSGGATSTPPINVQINLPDLKVINKAPILDSPLVMANIAKKNKFANLEKV